MHSKRGWRVLLGSLIVILSFGVTTWAWYANRVQARERARTRFHQEVSRSTAAIQARLAVYEDALYGTRSLFEANTVVTRQAFHDYVANLRIRERFPGIQGIGYAERVTLRQRVEHISRIRREGFSDYSIHPQGEREEYTAIIYLEPFDWRNQRAFGYDMFTEPVRRAAMQQARDTGHTSISGKVKLVQETETGVQAGFLMYLPLYRRNVPLATTEDRRSALIGYIYSPFRMNDLMNGVITEPLPLTFFEIFSGTQISDASLMYRSLDKSPNSTEELKETIEVNFGGQTWILRFASLPSYRASIKEGENQLIAPLGCLVSLFLSSLIFLGGRTEARALRLAESMTAKLRESEERTRAITESAADAIISADASGRITYFNSSAERIFGHLASEALGQPLAMLMPERYRSAHQAGLDHFLATGEGRVIGKSVELVGQRRGGSEFPVNLSLASWRAGSETHFTGILQDITERKLAEKALRQSEERYRDLFELNPQPTWVYDLSTLQFLAVNAAAIRRYGYSSQEFMGMTIQDIRPPEDIPALLERVSTPHDDRSARSWRHHRKDGQLLEVEVSSYRLIFDGRQAELVIAVDITERHRAEEALRQSEERLRLLIAGVKDYAIYTVDPRGKITSWNKGAERIKGYRAEEILGRHISQFYMDEDLRTGRPEHLLRQAQAEGRAEDEGWHVRKDGSRFWANVVVTALLDPDGGLVGFSKIIRDLTERKRHEQKLQNLNEELQRRNIELTVVNRELESFSYSVSHDLRAPLRAVDGFSAALLDDCHDKLDQKEKEYLGRIRAATARMGNLIDDLLRLARTARQQLNPGPVNLTVLAGEIANQLQASAPERDVTFIIAPDLTAEGDRGLLRLALENLLGNAWKFTSKGNRARIEFGRKLIKGEQVFFVSDDGAGFDMRYAGKLFGAFQRLHNEHEFYGNGIGLATVQRIVHRHGGRIWADSSVGQGTTFYFVLNATAPQQVMSGVA